MFSRAEGDELVDFLPGADYRHRTEAAERIRGDVEHPDHPGAIELEGNTGAPTRVGLGAPIPPAHTPSTIGQSVTPTSSLGVLEYVVTRSRSFDQRERLSSFDIPQRHSQRHRHSITGSPEIDLRNVTKAATEERMRRSERLDREILASSAARGISSRSVIRNVPSTERRPHTSLASSTSQNILVPRGLGSRRLSMEGLTSSTSSRGSSSSRLALRNLPPPAPPPTGPLPIPPASARLPVRPQRDEISGLPSRTHPVPIPQIVEPSSPTVQGRRRDDQANSNLRMRLPSPLMTFKPLPSIPGTLATPSPLDLPPPVVPSVSPTTDAARSATGASPIPSTPAFYTPIEDETSFDNLFFRPVGGSAPPAFGRTQTPSAIAGPSQVTAPETSGPDVESASVGTSKAGERSVAVFRRGPRPRTPAIDLSGYKPLIVVQQWAYEI